MSITHILSYTLSCVASVEIFLGIGTTGPGIFTKAQYSRSPSISLVVAKQFIGDR